MKLLPLLFTFFTVASTAQAEVVISCRSHVQGHDEVGMILNDDRQAGKVIFIKDGDEETRVKLDSDAAAIEELAPMKNWSVYALEGHPLKIAIPNSLLKIPSANVAKLARSGDWAEAHYIETGAITDMYGELFCTRLK